MHTIPRPSLLPHRLATHKGGWTPGRIWPGLVWRLVAALLRCQERASQRAALAALDDRMLKDIGLTPADVAAEVSKPFWRGWAACGYGPRRLAPQATLKQQDGAMVP